MSGHHVFRHKLSLREVMHVHLLLHDCVQKGSRNRKEIKMGTKSFKYNNVHLLSGLSLNFGVMEKI